jgi:hypothetical protein
MHLTACVSTVVECNDETVGPLPLQGLSEVLILMDVDDRTVVSIAAVSSGAMLQAGSRRFYPNEVMEYFQFT